MSLCKTAVTPLLTHWEQAYLQKIQTATDRSWVNNNNNRTSEIYFIYLPSLSLYVYVLVSLVSQKSKGMNVILFNNYRQCTCISHDFHNKGVCELLVYSLQQVKCINMLSTRIWDLFCSINHCANVFNYNRNSLHQFLFNKRHKYMPGIYGTQSAPAAHFTKVYSTVIQILWKIGFAAKQFQSTRSLAFFSHATTGELSWHVQNLAAIILLEFKFSMSLNYDGKC